LIGCAALNPVLQAIFQDETFTTRLLPAATVVLIFATSAHGLHAVTLSGAVAGAVLAFLLYVSTGPAGFVVLFSVFLLATVTTRLGYTRKQQLGTAERPGGRTASQVAANVGVAAVLAVLARLAPDPQALLLGAIAALTEAAADTVSSEIGQAVSADAYLITTFERVPAGTDGGVTLPGTLAGLVAAIIVSAVAALLGVIPSAGMAIVVVAAFAGTLSDSLLGASLERRGIIGNNTVNFTSTLLAAIVAVVLHQFG
jgi:uncharacterized protein (TIGR00297 family)